MYRVGSRHIKSRARNVSRRRKIDLPNGLLVLPLLDNIFRHFSGICQFFDGRDAFPVALGAVVYFGEFGVHLFKAYKSSKKTKNRVSERQRAPADKKKLALFLQFNWLIHVREIRLCGLSQFVVGVGLVVELA